MTVHRSFPSNLKELERICQEEWDKLAKSRRVKTVETQSGNRNQEVNIKMKACALEWVD